MSAQPTEPAPFAAQTFVDGKPVCSVTTARCWPCQFGQHTGGVHTWADDEEIAAAVKKGLPDPSTQRCGCPCTDEPERDVEPDPDIDEITFSDLEPCPVCGEHGPCSYDGEGRPMIHSDAFDDEEE